MVEDSVIRSAHYRRLSRHNSSAVAMMRLHCFPYAGAGCAMFSHWSSYLPTQIEVRPARLPGREGLLAAQPEANLVRLSESLFASMETSGVQQIALFGHSMGALLAFEVARRMREAGLQPTYLFVSACRAAQLPTSGQPLHGLSDREFLMELERRYGRVAGPSADNEELVQLMLPTLRADLTSVESYQYVKQAPLNCPIMAMGGNEDGWMSAAELNAWRAQTTGPFSLRMFSGGHFFLRDQTEQVVQTMGRKLRVYLDARPTR